MQSRPVRTIQLSSDDQRLLERIYTDLAFAFELDLTRMDPSLDSIDQAIHPGKFRQFIQQEGITLHVLKLLALRFLGKERADEDWDKLFLLLTQYACMLDPKVLYGGASIGYFEITRLLAPILGHTSVEPPECVLAELEPLHACQRLADADELKVLDRSRRIRNLAIERNDGAALVLATHFNLSVRKTFLRLLHLELASIYDLLGILENRGTRTFDGTNAGLSSAEPLARVRATCLKWTSPARVSFGSGDNFQEVIAIREALQQEVATIPLNPVQLAHEAAHRDDRDPVQGWLRETIGNLKKGRFHADVAQCDVSFTADEVRMLTSGQADEDRPLRRAIALRLLLTLICEGKTPPGRGFTLQQSYDIAVQEATALAAFLEEREHADTAYRYTFLTDELFNLMVDAREKIGFYQEAAEEKEAD
jgi:hypothetical protein